MLLLNKRTNNFHKLSETTTATALSFTTSDTESASIASSAISLNSSDEDAFANMLKTADDEEQNRPDLTNKVLI